MPVMLLQDLKYALRWVAVNKSFTVAAVLCLTLGIGTSTTGFSVIDGVLLQPLPYRDAHSLVVLNESQPERNIRFGAVAYGGLDDWRQQTSVFTTLAGFQARNFTLADEGEPERILGGAAGWELFPMFGVQPLLGRGLDARDDRPGAAPVVLLSHSLWQRRYGGSPTVLGRSVRVDGQPHIVIGVMPPGFHFPAIHHAWVPLAPLVHDRPRADRNVTAFARLAPGVTLERARADLVLVARRLEQQHPEQRGFQPTVRPMRAYFIAEDIQIVLLTIMGAVTLVLVAACANVANLLLARASTRRREIALRTALGASPWRVVQQLLTESVVLAVASTPAGLAFAYVAATLTQRAVPSDQVPSFVSWSIDLRSCVYALAAATVTGVLFGLFPALQALRVDHRHALQEAGAVSGGATRNRVLNALIVAEMAVCFVLLAGALLFVRTFVNLERTTGGFDARPLLTLRVYLPEESYASPEARVQRLGDILREVESLPGVEAAFASNMIPLSGGAYRGPMIVDGRPTLDGQEPIVAYVGVTPNLARTLGVPMRQGRGFTAAEALGRSRVALVGESTARQFWPDGRAVGGRFRLPRDGDMRDWLTVIGVVADFRQEPVPGRDQPPTVYLPYAYNALASTGLTIRARGDGAAVTAAVRDAVRRSEPNAAVAFVRPMVTLRQLGYWPYKIFGWVFSIMAGVALCLAVVGVYGVLAYSIAQRAREFGVRVALGAQPADVRWLVLSHGLKLAAAGIVLGLAAALSVAQAIRSVLYQVSPTDPLVFGAIALGLLLVVLVTAYLPARRATTVDPAVVLHAE
jgi:putative ABC transport system permease protein